MNGFGFGRGRVGSVHEITFGSCCTGTSKLGAGSCRTTGSVFTADRSESGSPKGCAAAAGFRGSASGLVSFFAWVLCGTVVLMLFEPAALSGGRTRRATGGGGGA